LTTELTTIQSKWLTKSTIDLKMHKRLIAYVKKNKVVRAHRGASGDEGALKMLQVDLHPVGEIVEHFLT